MALFEFKGDPLFTGRGGLFGNQNSRPLLLPHKQHAFLTSAWTIMAQQPSESNFMTDFDHEGEVDEDARKAWLLAQGIGGGGGGLGAGLGGWAALFAGGQGEYEEIREDSAPAGAIQNIGKYVEKFRFQAKKRFGERVEAFSNFTSKVLRPRAQERAANPQNAEPEDEKWGYKYDGNEEKKQDEQVSGRQAWQGGKRRQAQGQKREVPQFSFDSWLIKMHLHQNLLKCQE
jgi:hypothetical protein